MTYAILRRGEIYAEEHKTLKNGLFWMTRAYIASKLHKSKRAISNYIKELADEGIIERRCIQDSRNGFSIRDYFRINWDVVEGLENGDTRVNDVNEEPTTDHHLSTETRIQNRLEDQTLPIKHKEQAIPTSCAESPDREPDWCGRVPDDIDYQDWFEVTPPPGWSEDIVDPGEPPDLCGEKTPENYIQEPEFPTASLDGVNDHIGPSVPMQERPFVVSDFDQIIF